MNSLREISMSKTFSYFSYGISLLLIATMLAGSLNAQSTKEKIVGTVVAYRLTPTTFQGSALYVTSYLLVKKRKATQRGNEYVWIRFTGEPKALKTENLRSGTVFRFRADRTPVCDATIKSLSEFEVRDDAGVITEVRPNIDFVRTNIPNDLSTSDMLSCYMLRTVTIASTPPATSRQGTTTTRSGRRSPPAKERRT